MAAQAREKDVFMGQRFRWIVPCLILLQWCWIKQDNVRIHSEAIFTKPLQDSNSCIDVIRTVTNGKWANPETDTMGLRKSDSRSCKCPLVLTGGKEIFTGHDPVTDNIFFTVLSSRKTIIQLYMNTYLTRQRYTKHSYNIKETTIKNSMSSNRNLFKALVLILCACVFLFSVSSKYSRTADFGEMLTSKRSRSILKNQWNVLFRFNGTPRVNVQLFPFSLNQYVDDIVKEHKSTEELMKYEWSRYLSFKTFPMDCVMTPMRLSQAGFYYTGHGQEVKCFCCGMANGDWTTDETAIEVHKRLSPNCHFIRQENTDNVEIHNKEYYNGMFNVTSPAGSSRAVRFESGATGGPTDARNHAHREETNTTTTSVQKNSVNGKNHSSPAEQTRKEPHSQTRTTTNEQSANMKHPHYADLSTRAASFANWTLPDVQDPVELAQAGFFYTGMKDCVRCYYCGAGLKNWEKGDKPWEEHSRWSKSCGHLLNSRATGGPGDGQSNGSHNSEQRSAGSLDNSGNPSGSGGSDNNTGASGNTDMDSAAARSLLEMGYRHELVAEAIQNYREANGPRSMTAVALVELLEDKPSSEDISANSPASSVSQSTSNQSTATPEKETSASAEKQSPKKHIGSGGSGDAKSLVEENRVLKSQLQCKICMDRDANMVFLPCGHMVACQTCAVPLRKCAICRKLIKGTVRVYQS